MSSSGTNQLTQPTINGLSNLELTDLTADNLNANNIDGDFFSIETIEANDVQVDNELELTNSGFITIGKNTGSEITITDTQVGYLDGVTSNIQSQINSTSTDTSQLRIDLDALEDDVNDNTSRLGLQGATIDDLYVKTILQSASSIDQETTFSGKIILSSLSNLDVGAEIQQNTADIATNTSAISTNTSSISSLSSQQTTNSFLIQQNTLSIGTTSGGPPNSLFDRVKYITSATNNTYLEHALTIQTTGGSSISKVAISDGEIYITKDDPEIYFYRNDRPFEGPSAYLNVTSGGQFNLINYQQDRDILIGTAAGSTTARIDLNSNDVFVNGANVNDKFSYYETSITQINSDITQLSTTTSSLNTQQIANTTAIGNNTTSIGNNTTAIGNNTTAINTLQTQVPPVGSIMIFAAAVAPSGWLFCHGQSLSKFLYADLWNVIGDTYINGRPVRTSLFYNVDLRQLFITGAGNNASGYGINATTKSLGEFSSQSIMEHAHLYERPTNTFKASQSTFGTNVWRSNTQSDTSSGVILPGGGTILTASENLPYCMAMNYIIKT